MRLRCAPTRASGNKKHGQPQRGSSVAIHHLAQAARSLPSAPWLRRPSLPASCLFPQTKVRRRPRSAARTDRQGSGRGAPQTTESHSTSGSDVVHPALPGELAKDIPLDHHHVWNPRTLAIVAISKSVITRHPLLCMMSGSIGTLRHRFTSAVAAARVISSDVQ